MLEEVSSALNNYYGIPYIKNKKPNNLVLMPIKNNNINEINRYENLPSNKILSNYNIPKQTIFTNIPNFNMKNRILTPNYQDNQYINYLNKQPNLSSDIFINNYNKTKKKRPKSAAKFKKNKNFQNNRTYSFTENSFDNQNYKRNIIKGLKNNNKSTLIKNIKLNKDIISENDYDINYNINQFEKMLNTINLNGFYKIKEEINNKKILIAQLENSIKLLKNKIYLCKNNLYNGLHRETKNQIKYENMLCVSNRFKNSGKTADNYKDDIYNFQNKIDIINNETIELKKICLNEQNYIEIMKEEIKKGNKGISDKQKEIENILPALQLLKNHISSIKQKISKFNNIHKNYIEKLTFMENKI